LCTIYFTQFRITDIRLQYEGEIPPRSLKERYMQIYMGYTKCAEGAGGGRGVAYAENRVYATSWRVATYAWLMAKKKQKQTATCGTTNQKKTTLVKCEEL